MENREKLSSLSGRFITGFSLVELMVVIAIVALMGFFAAPEFADYRKNARLRNSARDIYGNIQTAKTEAAKRNTCVGVALTTVSYPTEGGTYTTFIDNGDGGGSECDGIQHADEPVISSPAITNVESGVSLYNAADIGGVSTVVVQPTGVTRNSQAGSIQLRTDNRWFQINVSAVGGLELEMSYDGTTWSY